MRISFSILFVLIGVSGMQAQTLEEYLSIAAENNPGLRAKYAQFEAAMQRSAQMAQMPNPVLSFGYFVQPIETRVGPQRAKIGLSQMFPWFGTLKSRGDAAAHIAESKYYEFIDVRELLFQNVKTAWFKIYQNLEIKGLESENLSILGTLRDLSLNKYENDKGSLADVYRADVLIDESETRIALLDEQLAALNNVFNNLLNRDAAEMIDVSDDLPVEADTMALQKVDFTGHPKLLGVGEMEASSLAAVRAATRAGYPGIGLGIDYIIVGERNDMVVPGSGKDALMPMVSVSLPIYRKGYRAARTEAQKSSEAYASQAGEIVNGLESSWAEASYRRLEALANFNLLQRQIDKTETILELLMSSYGNDAMAFEELLREQQKLLAYKKSQVRARVDYHIASTYLIYLMTNAK